MTELSGSQPASMSEILTVDFLLQHPSLLSRFARQGASSLPSAAEPSIAEMESSEEAFLRWKRSVVEQIAAPMLGRLIARGLVARSPTGELFLQPRGRKVVEALRASLRSSEATRLRAVSERVDMNRPQAREWLQAALAEEPS